MKIVVRQMPGEPTTDITGCFDIVFGEGGRQIMISIRDGKIYVNASAAQLVIEPRAANTVTITSIP